MSEAVATLPAVEQSREADLAKIREENAASKAKVASLSRWRAFTDRKIDLSGTHIDKVNELTTTKCAPSEIVAFPRAPQICVRPCGADKPVTFTVNESWAKLFAHHLKAMNTGGRRAYFDFDHSPKDGIAGYPLDYFWDGNRGVCCHVEWTPKARDLILSGKSNSFSPAWTHMKDGRPMGIGICCGALLASSSKPALNRMPPIQPELMRDSVKMMKKRFIERFDKKLQELERNGSDDFAALEAFATVAEQFPYLHDAYMLMDAINREFARDNVAAYS